MGHSSQRSLLSGFRKWPTAQTGVEKKVKLILGLEVIDILPKYVLCVRYLELPQLSADVVPLFKVVRPSTHISQEVLSVRLVQEPMGHSSHRLLLSGFNKWPAGQTKILNIRLRIFSNILIKNFSPKIELN